MSFSNDNDVIEAVKTISRTKQYHSQFYEYDNEINTNNVFSGNEQLVK